MQMSIWRLGCRTCIQRRNQKLQDILTKPFASIPPLMMILTITWASPFRIPTNSGKRSISLNSSKRRERTLQRSLIRKLPSVELPTRFHSMNLMWSLKTSRRLILPTMTIRHWSLRTEVRSSLRPTGQTMSESQGRALTMKTSTSPLRVEAIGRLPEK